MLTITNIHKTYPTDIKALCDINLEIKKGIFGLIGPNGSGKSTLMRIIATLLEPDSGYIQFEDIDVLHQKEKMRSVLGYLPQEFGAYPRVTAENLLRHLAVLKGIVDRKERESMVSHFLEITNLQEHRKKKLGSFSGGMKQRFGIAQALLGQPKLIILDEPTAGLDPSERNRFYNLLSTLSENVIIIFSTHIIADVNELCNNMAIIQNGKILTQITPINAVHSFQNKIWTKVVNSEDTKRYLEKYNVISSKLHYGKMIIKVFDEKQPTGFESVAPSLEDIYFSYINSSKEKNFLGRHVD